MTAPTRPSQRKSGQTPELNPDHGAEDGSTTKALVRGLVGALAG
jgi:hypothetical protein